jgi:hypothetical protein
MSMSKKNKEADNVQKVFWTVTNQASKLLLDVDPDTFEQRLFKAMGIVAKVVDVDRMYIWKNFLMDGKLHCSQIYEWSENVKSVQDTDLTIRIPYDEVAPDWEEQLSNGRSINSLVSNMAPEIREHLEKQGVLSILIEPIFIDEEFWGFVGFDDCHKERIFTDNEDEMLRLSALLFGQAYHRNEQEKKQKRKQKGKQEQEQGNLSANLERFANKLVRFGKKMDKRVVRLKRRYKKIVRKAIKPFKKFNKSIKKLKKDGLFGLATATTITTFVTLPIVLLILVLVLKKNVNNGSLQKTKTIVVNGVPFDMIFVNGCTFTMGGLDTRDNGSNRDNEKPFFTAVVRDFYISNTPVTQTLWKAVMNRNPSTIIGQDLPVVNVSWDDCQVFIQRLNNLTGMKFRLPTEAEC